MGDDLLVKSLGGMAFIGLRVPHEVARLLGTVEVPGEPESTDHMHITVVNIGNDIPIEQISKAVTAIHDVATKMVPFRVALDHVSSFPKNDSGSPIICPVTSPELHQLEGLLKKSLDELKIDYSKKFPVFKPHVTLAYLKEGDPPKDQPLGPLEWSVYEMVLWGGDSGDERLSVTFPFALPGKTALYRHLVQAQLRLASRV